jgi:hypothetical protein
MVMTIWEELENRIRDSQFTARGVFSLDQCPVRRFTSSLMPDEGWYFHRGTTNDWAGPFDSRAEARSKLSEHLVDDEETLVRALTADFSHSGWIRGYWREHGNHVHVIRYHDGFIHAFAVHRNRIELVPEPAIPTALRVLDSFVILGLDSGAMARTFVLRPTLDKMRLVLPINVDDDIHGLTAQSFRTAIDYFDSLGHDKDEQETEDD